MTLKIYKSVRKAFPVTVLKLDKHPALIGAELQTLRCTCCQQALGDRPWALAWIDDGKEKRSVRICEDCIKEAEAPDKSMPVLGTVAEAELKASLVAIHYHATRLYNMLQNKVQFRDALRTERTRSFLKRHRDALRGPKRKGNIDYSSIVHSVIKECEDRIPELRKDNDEKAK